MQNILNELTDCLKEDERLVIDGRLAKNKIIELALALDESLIKLLLKNESIKKHFFRDVDGVLVFDKVDFQKFVSNKQFLPDSYTAFKNKIGLTVNREYLTESKEVVLAWPYKDCVLEGGQTKEDQKRKEIFWNETLAPDEIDRLLSPKVLTNFKRYDKEGEHPVERISLEDNLIIKGNNLLALESLKKVYAGKIKLIYIDPPYNTGNDSFGYNDRFNHSTWLTFMVNRLSVAKELLSDDGYILIQIDNNESAYLKTICDEIFGISNYRNSIITKKGMKSLQKQFTEIQHLSAGFDTILLYTKNDSTKLPNLFKELKGATSSSWNNHWRGTDRPTMRYEIFGINPDKGQWRWERSRTIQAMENYEKLLDYIKIFEGNNADISNEIIEKYYSEYLNEYDITEHSDFELVRLSKHGKPEHYIPPRTEVLLSENWMDLNVAGRVTKFAHEKNEEIIKRIIEWLTKENDIVLDFFLGSGSTASVAHKLNRQYIGIEQLDYGKLDAIHRLQKVIKGDKKGISKSVDWRGGGSFLYAELANLNAYWIDKIDSIKDGDLNKLYLDLKENPFINYRVDLDEYSRNSSGFNELNPVIKRKILKDILDINQVYINLSEITDSEYKVSNLDIMLNNNFYNQS